MPPHAAIRLPETSSRMIRKSFTLLVFCLSLSAVSRAPAQADEEEENAWPFCPAPIALPEAAEIDDVLEPGDIHVLAEDVDAVEGGLSHLEGNVQITRDNWQVQSHSADYNELTDSADFAGDVQYWDPELYLRGSSAHLDFEAGTGTAADAEYHLLRSRGRGTAQSIALDFGATTSGTQIDFTTCDPEAPGADLLTNFWKLSAAEIHLDHDAERGTAKHAVLRIKDVPVFYSPWLTFPLTKKRKSGFLWPGFGTTNNNGFELRLPYYWNIHPQFDATLMPRLMTDSGVMGSGEFRWLLRRGTGQLNLEYLPDDEHHDNEDRSLVGFLHQQRFADTGRMFLTYNRVSDREYFEDFGNQIAITSRRYLERRAELSYGGEWWNARGRVQDYQVVDDSIGPDSIPYQRLPQLRVNLMPWRGNNRINVTIPAELAYFNRDNDEDFVSDVNGMRYDLFPNASYPMRSRSGFVIPRVGVRFTQYDLDDPGPFDDSPSRVLPLASLDAGLFLEREFDFGALPLLQTLEPRLYYLYIPDDDQDDLPVFDTSLYNLSYHALYRPDRFTGADRMGDANQVTAGFTTRVYDRGDGGELFYARVAQVYFLSDVDVIRTRLRANGTLISDGRTTEQTLGPVVVDVGTRVIDDWLMRGEVQWDPERGTTEKMAIRAQYRPDDGRVLNLSYRVRRPLNQQQALAANRVDVEQTDVSFRWPLTEQWSAVGRWNYAVPESKTLELFGGVEYQSCCWGIRMVARRFLNNLDGDYSTGIFLQLELKGLAGIGEETVDFLSERIPGYETEF
jgi:LPS-assembly protein